MKATQFPNAKFTPGPWMVDPHFPANVMQKCADPYTMHMEIIINGYDESYVEIHANARLIAEAPNTLLALFNLVNAVSGGSQEDIKIAIADAKQTIKNATNV